MKYFCNTCGLRFESGPERDENGMLNDICCPNGCGWNVYPDTVEGRAQSVLDLTEYENVLLDLED